MNILMLFFFSAAFAGEIVQEPAQVQSAAPFGTIDSKALKALMDTHTPMVLIDARGDDWNVGTTIAGAKLARHDSPVELFSKLIPQKDTLVVVFCYSASCPLGPKLRDKLVSLGYTNVIEYQGGVTDWRDVAKYPTEPLFRVHLEDSAE
jgi:rhodanese-related sulfurtransferase